MLVHEFHACRVVVFHRGDIASSSSSSSSSSSFLYLLSHSVIYTTVTFSLSLILSNPWGPSREDCIGAALCCDEHEGIHDVLAVEVCVNTSGRSVSRVS